MDRCSRAIDTLQRKTPPVGGVWVLGKQSDRRAVDQFLLLNESTGSDYFP